ncbi:hypothetical protein HUB97_06790 [Halorubraceae archaeon YAN]|nr:hypothetical protein [Halorubraceae archaeon YAN]
MTAPHRSVAIVLVATVSISLLLLASVSGASALTTGAAGVQSQTNEELGQCFPGDGYSITIGSQGPQIDSIVHFSLLTNLGAPGSMGIEMAGTTGDEYIILLRTGVLFEGVGEPTAFLADPMAHFSVAFEFDFSLPMFDGMTDGGDFSYSGDGAPIDAPIGDAVC